MDDVIVVDADGMVPIDRCAGIRKRLALPAKLTHDERERIEIRLSNWFCNGLVSDDEYRAVTRSLEDHA